MVTYHLMVLIETYQVLTKSFHSQQNSRLCDIASQHNGSAAGRGIFLPRPSSSRLLGFPVTDLTIVFINYFIQMII